MGTLLRWLRRTEHGQDLIEFAVSVMFLMLLAAGIVDFGGAFQNYVIVTNAAREGARLAARAPCRPADAAQRLVFHDTVVAAVLAEAASSNVTLLAGNVTITPDPVGAGCPAAGAPIMVSVTHSYSLMFSSMLGVGSLTLRGSTTMVFFGNDQAHGPPALVWDLSHDTLVRLEAKGVT